jgi:RHS repeat-associated protein
MRGTTTNRLFWNGRNQLTNITGAVSASFVYDGLGRRMTRKIGAGITEQYLYDGLDIILMKDGSNKIRTRYFRGLAIDEPWQRIDFGTKRNSPSTNRVYMADALGSIVALADTGKVIQTEYDYQPFGATTTTGAGNKNSYKFTAREEDGTGLYYYRGRYYHPVLGRFVSEDPIGYSGRRIGLFVYVSNNPLIRRDPAGLKDCKEVPGSETFENPGAAWSLRTFDFYGTEAGMYVQVEGVDATWRARVCVICDCCGQQKKVCGTRGVDKKVELPLAHQFEVLNTAAGLLELPFPAKASEAIGELLASVVQAKLPGIYVVPVEGLEFTASALKSAWPKKPNEGTWSGGSPCK